MRATPAPTMSEIACARDVICSSWSEPRRAARQQEASARQRQLMRRLLGHFGNAGHERTTCSDE